MSDDRLRASARAYAAEASVANLCAYVMAWFRAGGPDPRPTDVMLREAWLGGGGRDPRLWPWPGDVVATEENVYRARQFTVVRMRFPTEQGQASLGAYYDPATHRTPRGAPQRWAQVRRRRTLYDGTTRDETVSLIGWRKGLVRGRVIKVACSSCDGTGGPPGEGLRLLEQANRGVDPVLVTACAACLGLGWAIDPRPEKRRETKAEREERQRAVVERRETPTREMFT